MQRTPLAILPVFAFALVGATHAQITSNPIPEPIVKRGIAVEIKDLVRLPDTRGLRPADQDVMPSGWARVSYVRDLPDGRRFANDSRGLQPPGPQPPGCLRPPGCWVLVPGYAGAR